MDVEFVRGKPPVLFIFDDDSGEVEESVYLEKLKIDEVLHQINQVGALWI